MKVGYYIKIENVMVFKSVKPCDADKKKGGSDYDVLQIHCQLPYITDTLHPVLLNCYILANPSSPFAYVVLRERDNINIQLLFITYLC